MDLSQLQSVHIEGLIAARGRQGPLDHSFCPFMTSRMSFKRRALCVTPCPLAKLSPIVTCAIRDSSYPLSNALHKFKNNTDLHFFE